MHFFLPALQTEWTRYFIILLTGENVMGLKLKPNFQSDFTLTEI